MIKRYENGQWLDLVSSLLCIDICGQARSQIVSNWKCQSRKLSVRIKYQTNYPRSCIPELIGAISRRKRYNVRCAIFRRRCKAVDLESIDVGLVKNPYLWVKHLKIRQNFWYCSPASVIQSISAINKIITIIQTQRTLIKDFYTPCKYFSNFEGNTKKQK